MSTQTQPEKMEVTLEFLHQRLLCLQSVDAEYYADHTEMDMLAQMLSHGEVENLAMVAWDQLKYKLVDTRRGYEYEDRENFKWCTGEDIDTGNALFRFTDKITSREARIRVLVHLRDHAGPIFANNQFNAENFEKECVRLLSINLRECETQPLPDDLEPITRKELEAIVMKGFYSPEQIKKTSELEKWKKMYDELETEYRKTKHELDMLLPKYNQYLAYWEKRHSRKIPIQYGIPPELKTPAAKWIIDRLCEKGYIQVFQHTYNNTQILNWEKSKSLFAYFVEHVTEFLQLRDTNEQIPWKLFEGAFISGGEIDPSFHKGLKDLVSKYHKTGKIPQNDDVIHKILQEAKSKPWETKQTDSK